MNLKKSTARSPAESKRINQHKKTIKKNREYVVDDCTKKDHGDYKITSDAGDHLLPNSILNYYSQKSSYQLKIFEIVLRGLFGCGWSTLRDLALKIEASSNAKIRPFGTAIVEAVDLAVATALGKTFSHNGQATTFGGFNFMADYQEDMSYLTNYSKGTWATTGWDDVLLKLANNRISSASDYLKHVTQISFTCGFPLICFVRTDLGTLAK